MTPSRRALLAAGALLAAVAGGCAERQLVTAPRDDPGAGSWLVVGVAVALATATWAVLLTLDVWRGRRPVAPLATAVLAATGGGVVVGAAVLIGVAVRSWQLLDRGPGDPEPALLRLSRVDGDTGFFALMVLVVVIAGALLALLLLLGARWAADGDPGGRIVAAVLLGVQAVLGLGAVVLLATGSDAWPYVVLAGTTPLTVAAMVTCWPRSRAL